MPTWDADLYLKFSGERTRPALDLLARIPTSSPRRVVDLGCGPGNSTALLRARWPQAEIVGLDSSAEMIAAAQNAYPQGRWVLGDVAAFADGGGFDVVFSNATLQWVPDHVALFPRLLGLVRPGGVLAVQMPLHDQSRVHHLIAEIADLPEWRDSLTRARGLIRTEQPAFYYDLLRPLVGQVDLWVTEYIHALDGPEAIVAWIAGTGLRPYLEALDEGKAGRFRELLRERVAQAYPRQKDGRVLLPYRRLFVIGEGPITGGLRRATG